MFIVTKEGVMVIDPMNAKHARNMLTEIRNITDAPIKYLFYSHNHWDHISGGQVFKDEGACIIAHSDAEKFMKANPNPKVFCKKFVPKLSKLCYERLFSLIKFGLEISMKLVLVVFVLSFTTWASIMVME